MTRVRIPPMPIRCNLNEQPLSFGKYQGKSPNQIAMINPRYIIWLWENVGGAFPPVTKDLVLDCEYRLMTPEDRDDVDSWSDAE